LFVFRKSGTPHADTGLTVILENLIGRFYDGTKGAEANQDVF
jgi:hypothetical protein